ncbi:hypothetical protein, partial [Acidovorax sp.]|uniref:hypothetical protein n=1 Tax=Acidovorax sp. TaxID=1872122 RepID=UPI00391F387C
MLLTGVAYADPFSYKGVKIGDSLEEFQTALPGYVCNDSRCTFDPRKCEERLAAKEGGDISSRIKACADGSSFGGAPVKDGHVVFIDGKLAYLRLSIESVFLDMAAGPALETKFGRPQSIDETPATNGAGVKFRNWIKTWAQDGQTMRAALRSGIVDTGSVTITSEAFEKRQREALK